MPNLFVAYREVDLVYWRNETCSADLNDEGDFPSSFIFNVEAPENEPALSFYSRKHIETVKMVELRSAIAAQTPIVSRVQIFDVICCVQSVGSCLGASEVFRECNVADYEYEQSALDVLILSLASWGDAFSKSDENVQDAIDRVRSIVDWFEDAEVGQKGMNTEESVQITDFIGMLAPNQLIEDAKKIAGADDLLGLAPAEDGKDNIRNTKRIQFSGSTGTYELSLDKTRSSEEHSQDCSLASPLIAAGAAGAGAVAFGPALPLAAGALVIGSAIAGCNYEIDAEVSIGDVELKFLTFGIGAGSTIGGGKCVQE